MQKKGYLSFVLHAHLPFIHHPESDDYLEESWLYEAISETYIPLLQNFQKLVDEGVKFRVTMTMTPPLLSMLDSKLLKKKYINYLKEHIELSEKEIDYDGNAQYNGGTLIVNGQQVSSIPNQMMGGGGPGGMMKDGAREGFERGDLENGSDRRQPPKDMMRQQNQ